MSNRCPDCNKFVPLEPGDPEVSSIEIDNETGEVTASVRLVVVCSECTGEMKDCEIEAQDIPDDVSAHIAEHEEKGEEYTLEVEEDSLDPNDRYQTSGKDKHGEEIKWKPRYWRHFYGFDLTANVTCSCGAHFGVQLTGEEQAGSFNDLN